MHYELTFCKHLNASRRIKRKQNTSGVEIPASSRGVSYKERDFDLIFVKIFPIFLISLLSTCSRQCHTRSRGEQWKLFWTLIMRWFFKYEQRHLMDFNRNLGAKGVTVEPHISRSPNIQELHYSAFQGRHNGCGSVSNHQPHDCLLNRLFRRRSKKISKPRVTGLCVGEFTGDRWIPRTNGQ